MVLNSPGAELHCSDDEFRCTVDGHCIHNKSVCDGIADCPVENDESDETDCSKLGGYM